MADVNLEYASNTAITINTGTLAADVYRSSTWVDNNSNLYVDALLQGQFKTHASNASSDLKAFRIWLVASTDDSNFTDAIGENSASVTPTDPPNMMQLASVFAPAANTTYNGGPWSIAQAFGGILPVHWGVVVENVTGETAPATPIVLEYVGVIATVV